MTIKTHRHFFFAGALLLFVVLLSSCAQVVPPGGGDRDKTAPKVLRYIPDSAKLNFNAKYIVIDFDEYIQLKDLNNQLIISPPFANSPDVKVKNKTLTIDLSKEKLLPNTTYSVKFGNALQDNNEGNALEDFNYIFSTGPYIDSLGIKGKVQSAFNHKAEKGILVMLYSDLSDSAIYKSQPDFFGKTTADGSFGISNVRPGKYRIYALKDANSDFKYNGESESIGFLEGTVEPYSKTDTTVKDRKEIRIETFEEHPKKVFLKKYAHNTYGKISLYLNRGSDSIRVNTLTAGIPPDDIILNYSKHKDTITYWLKNYDKDSLKLQIVNDTAIVDTVELKLIKKEDALKSKRNSLKLFIARGPGGSQTFDLNADPVITFNNPIAGVDESKKIIFTGDSTISKNRNFSGISAHRWQDLNSFVIGYWDSTLVKNPPKNLSGGGMHPVPVYSSLALKESTSYTILILPGTFTDIFGLTNDSIKLDFKTQEMKFYGTLKLKIDAPPTKGNYIVQLMDEKETVIREKLINKPGTLDFEYLYPNKYKVKLIYDENANGEWDSGNYLEKIQPERVIYNTEVITIRSNWDADIEWNIKTDKVLNK